MATSTVSTVIGAFSSSADAQAAAKDLQSAGIDRNNIYLEGPSNGSDAYASRSADNEGGISGWFKSFFEPADESDHKQYQGAVQSGKFLLSVDVEENQASAVEKLMNQHSPVDVRSDDAHSGVDTMANEGGPIVETDRTATGSTPVGAVRDGSEAIPIVEESIQVGKRRVSGGGVRVYSRVVERPVEETVSLKEEHVRVDRQPVDRPATEADLDAGREQVIEVQEYAEKPVVEKTSRVVEEVHIGKNVEERQETVRDTVRHTEVDVKAAGKQSGNDTYTEED